MSTSRLGKGKCFTATPSELLEQLHARSAGDVASNPCLCHWWPVVIFGWCRAYEQVISNAPIRVHDKDFRTFFSWMVFTPPPKKDHSICSQGHCSLVCGHLDRQKFLLSPSTPGLPPRIQLSMLPPAAYLGIFKRVQGAGLGHGSTTTVVKGRAGGGI